MIIKKTLNMSRSNLFLILFLSTFSVFSQKHYVGLSFNTTNSYRIEGSNAKYFNDLDKKIMSFEAGIRYEHQLFNKLYLSTGIIYAIKGYDRKVLILPSPHSQTHLYKYIEVPIAIKYTIVNAKRIKLNLVPEIRNQFLVQAVYTSYDFMHIPWYAGGPSDPPQSEKDVANRKELKQDGFNMYNIGVGGRIELLYRIYNTFYIGLSPNINYSLRPITGKDEFDMYYEPPNEKLYAYGIELKVIYGLEKRTK